MFRQKFWGTLALSIPTLVWAPMLQRWFHYTAPAFPGARLIPALFGTAVYFYGGWVFIRGAKGELEARLPGMMTLIALAITVSFVFSLAVTLGYPGMDLWWELATLVTIMVLGHWIEMRSIVQASGALKELTMLLPAVAARVRGDRIEEVSLDQLRQDDVVLVRPGSGIPADGVVIEGESAVTESMITGESAPVVKTPGSEVVGGTINGTGSLRVRLTRVGADTALAGMMRLVEQAQNSRSRAQALADRAAFALTIVAVLSAVITLIAWLAAGEPLSFAIERVVTVLVISCPHALGLAIPLVVAISTTIGAKNGLLVRDRRGLEEARNLDTILMDKTGTLTRAEFRVVELTTTRDLTGDDALRLASAVERESEHPIARGVVATSAERGVAVPRARDFASIPGRGVRATVEGRSVTLGGPAMLEDSGAALPPELSEAMKRASSRGQASGTSDVPGTRLKRRADGAVVAAARISISQCEAVRTWARAGRTAPSGLCGRTVSSTMAWCRPWNGRCGSCRRRMSGCGVGRCWFSPRSCTTRTRLANGRHWSTRAWRWPAAWTMTHCWPGPA